MHTGDDVHLYVKDAHPDADATSTAHLRLVSTPGHTPRLARGVLRHSAPAAPDVASASNEPAEAASAPTGQEVVDDGPTPDGTILVGVDGSEAALRVLDWAAAHAGATGAPLSIYCITRAHCPVLVIRAEHRRHRARKHSEPDAPAT